MQILQVTFFFPHSGIPLNLIQHQGDKHRFISGINKNLILEILQDVDLCAGICQSETLGLGWVIIN